MTTAVKIIKKALRRIGVHGLKPVPAEALNEALFTLNAMLDDWATQDIDIPYFLCEVTADELGEPADTREAIINNLAVLESPNWDNGNDTRVSARLLQNAKMGFLHVIAGYRCFDVPLTVLSSTTPVGAGNITEVNSQVFWGTNRKKTG